MVKIYKKKTTTNICSFRINAHRLHIEEGRYAGTIFEDPLCSNFNEIENEIHFMFKCQKYIVYRNYMIEELKDLKIRYTDG